MAPRIRRIKQAHPDRILIASIMAGSGNDKELQHWQLLARECQAAGADGLELNFSCPTWTAATWAPASARTRGSARWSPRR